MVGLRRGVPAWCLRVFFLVLLLTSLLSILPPPLAAQAVRYEYDALGRLTVVSTPEGVAIYEYDAVGNILRITTHRYREAPGPVAMLALSPGRGGPGGFDGVAGSDAVSTTAGGPGQGPGGGGAGSLAVGGGGGYATSGAAAPDASGGAGGVAYGSSLLRPIVGGSGGAIRLIAPTISGNAPLWARGGSTGYPYTAGQGGDGRIRLEAATLSYISGYGAYGALPYPTTAYPQPVFLAAGQPVLSIASVGGVPAPALPTGNIAATPDIVLPAGTTGPVPVVLSASISLDLAQTSVLTASATFPLLASAGGGPIYAEGEEVRHVQVAAVLGGGTQVTYITQSGREIIQL